MSEHVLVPPGPLHARYRDALTLLANRIALQTTLAAWSGIDGWRRIYGRFMPTLAARGNDSGAPYALLVFENGDPVGSALRSASRQMFLTVEISERPLSAAASAVMPAPALGWLRVTAFPNDDRLPTLPAALDVEGEVTVVRYRPGRRCTFRVTDRHHTRFGKVFNDDSGRAIHEMGVALDAASRRGQIGCAVAPPLSWDAERRVLWQGLVTGAPLLDRLSEPGSLDLARRMGVALGTIAVAPLAPATTFDAAVQIARSRSYVRELGMRVPALAADATALGEGLAVIHRQRPGRACPIHGAPHVNQWLLDGDRLALVDFDRCAMGNPELDVATFLGELDFEEELTTPVASVATAFIDGYESTAGRLDSTLLAAYRAHKRLAKALRSARALRPDGDARARVHLASAVAALAGLA